MSQTNKVIVYITIGFVEFIWLKHRLWAYIIENKVWTRQRFYIISTWNGILWQPQRHQIATKQHDLCGKKWQIAPGKAIKPRMGPIEHNVHINLYMCLYPKRPPNCAGVCTLRRSFFKQKSKFRPPEVSVGDAGHMVKLIYPRSNSPEMSYPQANVEWRENLQGRRLFRSDHSIM